MKETGCHAVKLEGGREYADRIKAIVEAGIPVVAHVGLTPQSVNAFGGYKVLELLFLTALLRQQTIDID